MGWSRRDLMHGRTRGFTLVELLVTLAVLVLVLTVAIPSMRNFVKNGRLTSAANDLAATLAFARSEAVRRGRPVTVCASTDGSSCDTADWERGWIVFTDGGTAGSVDGSDQVLRVQGKAGDGVEIDLSGTSYVRFLGTGELQS